MTKAAVATKSDKFAWPATMPAHIAAYLKKYPLLPDGVYVGLSNERYHADPALGSSNIRDILKGANLYWFKSWMNPTRAPDKATPSKILGSATHALLLDGWDVFKDAYLRGPYSSADDHLSPGEKSALTKAAKAKLTRNVRGTKGSKQKLGVTVQGQPGLVLVAADGTPMPGVLKGPTAPAATPATTPSTPAASGSPVSSKQ